MRRPVIPGTHKRSHEVWCLESVSAECPEQPGEAERWGDALSLRQPQSRSREARCSGGEAIFGERDVHPRFCGKRISRVGEGECDIPDTPEPCVRGVGESAAQAKGRMPPTGVIA